MPPQLCQKIKRLRVVGSEEKSATEIEERLFQCENERSTRKSLSFKRATRVRCFSGRCSILPRDWIPVRQLGLPLARASTAMAMIAAVEYYVHI